MVNNIIKIQTRTDNPWVPGEVVGVPRVNAEAAAQRVADFCETLREKEWQAAQYDGPVNKVLKTALPGVHEDNYVALAAVVKVLGEMVRDDKTINDWYSGSTSAFRTCRCLLAYSTPGFGEALSNS